MKFLITLLGFLLVAKNFFFWLWLWQLKEYHWGRFKAHFETQSTRKIISSFWRLKKPKLTPKTIVISFSAVVLMAVTVYLSAIGQNFYLIIFLLFFLSPLLSSLFILFFQLPTLILRNRILKKARKKREKFKNLLVVGITGSYGKTSTKEFLASILSEKYKVLKTKEHQNSEIGISQTILNQLNKEHEIFVVEMGAYSKGGIKLLCDISQPQIGIIAGINQQHLSTFGTMEKLISAEGGKELIENLLSNKRKIKLGGLTIEKMVFLNAKNKYCLDLYQTTDGLKKFLYGQNIKMIGLENIEGAKTLAKELGLKENEIEKACQKIKNKFPGIKIKKGINNLILIDAAYSANPDSIIAHLEYLGFEYPKAKKVIIMPCLIELGIASKEIHKKIGQKINQSCHLAIITTKDRFKEIKQEAREKAVLIEKPKEILKKVKGFCDPGDVILLEGRVPHQIIEQLTIKN